VLAHRRGALSTTVTINGFDCRRADVYNMGEQRRILSTPLACGSKARGVEFIGDKHLTEVAASGFEALVGLEIAHELLLAVGSNAPLGRHQSPSCAGQQGEIDLLHFFGRG